MESTAQYWQPVWAALERYWKPIREKREGARRRSGTLHLAQAQSNRGRRGRKRDFPDAERLVKRLVARELILSFVPDTEQRLWRTVTRKKYQLRCDRVRLQNQVESHADMRSYKKVNDHTLAFANKKGDKVTISGRGVVSADGKSRTVTISGTDSKGKKYTSTAVYDKQ